MSTVDNNPVYFIEEDQKIATTSYYRSKNQALLNKATQPNWKHRKTIRMIIVTILLVLAITCGTLIHAFASGHEQLAEGSNGLILVEKSEPVLKRVDIIKGDTLWSIANEHAPSDISVSSYVRKIMKLNHLETPDIQEGFMLLLP